VADEVNARVIGFLKQVKKYATVNYVLFEPLSIRYVCGGGNGLLVRNEQMITFSKLDPFLGLRTRPYRESVLPFEEGDLLCLYTDGIVESQDQAEQDYTIRRLNRLIHRHSREPVESIVEACIQDYHEFCEEPHDDVTLMVMRKKANGYS
jgi:sigma-B regulation protein RsbU (phosphoserine phosphatase)